MTTAVFLFLILRLFAVAGYDWHTAFAVLHTLDLDDGISIVLGTVMASSLAAALFLALLVPVAVFRLVLSLRAAGEERRERERSGLPAGRPDLEGVTLLVIALAAVAAYVWSFKAWWLPVAAALVGALFFSIAYGMKSTGFLRTAALWAGRHLGALMVGALLIGAATVSTPWVPLERIALTDGQQIRGYVMEAEPGFLKVLTDHDREFLILNDGDVASREELGRH
ncbi:hypothetical protein [Streptomyces sp. NPDC094032]|uniref:hypothetical protein n=1 Tax=Streptomyces sp. NPDC094032 TaxID=3155308 RepID=UPI00331C37CD